MEKTLLLPHNSVRKRYFLSAFLCETSTRTILSDYAWSVDYCCSISTSPARRVPVVRRVTHFSAALSSQKGTIFAPCFPAAQTVFAIIPRAYDVIAATSRKLTLTLSFFSTPDLFIRLISTWKHPSADKAQCCVNAVATLTERTSARLLQTGRVWRQLWKWVELNDTSSYKVNDSGGIFFWTHE